MDKDELKTICRSCIYSVYRLCTNSSIQCAQQYCGATVQCAKENKHRMNWEQKKRKQYEKIAFFDISWKSVHLCRNINTRQISTDHLYGYCLQLFVYFLFTSFFFHFIPLFFHIFLFMSFFFFSQFVEFGREYHFRKIAFSSFHNSNINNGVIEIEKIVYVYKWILFLFDFYCKNE